MTPTQPKSYQLMPRTTRAQLRPLASKLFTGLATLAVLLAINLMTDPHDLWVRWPALGIAIMVGLPYLRHLVLGRPLDARGK